MRTHGKLVKWNDERGFGFVSDGPRDIFVHISAFPRDGNRPELNELISFEVEIGPNGKQRAIRVTRAHQGTPNPPRSAPRPPRSSFRGGRSHGSRGGSFLVLIVVVVGIFAYSKFQDSVSSGFMGQARVQTSLPVRPSVSYKCDGRTMCSQMTSCAEAEYFLRNCPNTQMDGNNDGEPCEQQWCN
jgi:cold shock CspA family protein